jgi:hypothetical protein
MKRFHSHNAYTNYDGYWYTLQSYNTAVVKVNEILDKVVVSQWYDYSMSTRKQVCRFLNENARGFYGVQHWGIHVLRELVLNGVIETDKRGFNEGW